MTDHTQPGAESSAPDLNAERALFEHVERASDLTRSEGGYDDYLNPCVQSAWDGWKARAALARRVTAPHAAELARLHSTLYAIANTLNDDELRGAARDAYDTAAAQPVEAAGSAVQAEPVWLSVKDQLPKPEHECTSRDMLVSNSFFVRGTAVDSGEGFGMADYQDDGKWHCYGGDYDFMHIADVTHYMPVRSAATHPAEPVGDTRQFRKLTNELSLKELAAEFHAVASLGGDVTISAGVCQKLFDAMTTPPAEPVVPAVGSALVAKADPVYQMRQIAGGGWVETDADEATCLKRMPDLKGVFEFRTLYTAPTGALVAVRDEQQGTELSLKLRRAAVSPAATVFGGALMLAAAREIERLVAESAAAPADRKPRSEKQIVWETETLAAELAKLDGYAITSGTWRDSPSPTAQQYWKRACLAQEVLTKTDPNDAVANLDEE